MDLAAQHRSRRKVFVNARHEVNSMLLEQRLYTIEREVIASERRAFVSRNERSRLQTRLPIAAHLIHGQAHQRLNPCEICGPVFRGIAIVELQDSPPTGIILGWN